MSRFVVYQQPINKRSEITCRAMLAGIRRVEGLQKVVLQQANQYVTPHHDAAVFYGLHGRLTAAMEEYSKDPKRHAVYIDLGYFGRRDGGKLFGFHKIAVDGRHPTPYFQNRPHDGKRWARFAHQHPIRPWRAPSKDSPIILAGMGPKGAGAEGFGACAWEMEAVKIIRRHTRRPIIYRPKPNWEDARPIPGTQFTRPDSVKLDDQLRGAHCIVSHHSNTNVEALLMGIPSFTVEGIAVGMSKTDLSQIEDPYLPEGREQWLHDLAYTQWSVQEMQDGIAWRYLRDEGLIQ